MDTQGEGLLTFCVCLDLVQILAIMVWEEDRIVTLLYYHAIKVVGFSFYAIVESK